MSLPLDSGSIVTITGIRRCGKSSLMGLTINELLRSGISKDKILYLGFDDERFDAMRTEDFDEILVAYREMYPHIDLKDIYMFFDEIQLIKGWELFILRVFKNYCKNIFITGSTSEMLSNELTSALRGWPDEYKMHPLSFNEYLSFLNVSADGFSEQGAAIIKNEFKSYCTEGGFPKVVQTEGVSEKIKILQTYFNTMLFRDLIEHYQIKSSTPAIKYFLKRLIANITKPTSVNNIYNELKSQGINISKDSLYQWLEYACEIFLLYKVPKYTPSIVAENSALSKYYVADTGLKNAILSPKSEDEGKALENIVYLHLIKTLGEADKIYYWSGKNECDFVVRGTDGVSQLIQVCWALNEENRKREIDGLLEVSKHTGCQCLQVITFEQESVISQNNLSIRVLPAWKWLR